MLMQHVRKIGGTQIVRSADREAVNWQRRAENPVHACELVAAGHQAGTGTDRPGKHPLLYRAYWSRSNMLEAKDRRRA